MSKPASIAEGHAPLTGKWALVFPGQGSQFVGMGRDLCERFPAARRVFEEADAVLGFSLTRLCFEGPEAELTDTWNAQPAILTMSAACLTVVQERAPGRWKPSLVAGHSLGEYTALWAAGVLDFASALRLVRERGRLMKEAGECQPGAMAAVLGMPTGPLREVCAQVGEVWVANDNSPGQVVVSGKKDALEEALQLAKERGAKRAIPLAVSIASHSPLMTSAAESLAVTIGKLTLSPAVPPVVANVTAAPVTEPADVRLELIRQLTSPVRWVESVQYMIAQGVRSFVEIGPKNVLSRLINQIDPGVSTLSVGSVTDVEALEASRP
jgi:[acyl-carrier-protein] S-malonyltransferase